jgi:glycerol-3-phosphate cytidylyltransferase
MRTGFACGMFDLFHAGHVLMLKECKENCDYLVVALNKGENISDEINPGKRKPFYSIEERKLIMESCRFVDEVVVYNSEEELYGIMKDKKISVRFLGDDYKGKPITGSDLDIEIYYTNRDHGFSTTAVLQRIVGQNPKQ